MVRRFFGHLMRQAAMPLLTLGLLTLIWHRFPALDIQTALAALAQLELWRWGTASLAVAISFAAIGRYDALIHRHLATGVPAGPATMAGAAAIALSQMAGFGLISGTLARWRLLPDLGLARAMAVTLWVAAAFMAALAVLVALAVVLLDAAGSTGAGWPSQSPALHAVAASILLAAGALPVMILGWPALARRLPPLPVLGGLLVCAALDTGAACLALWVLWPGGPGFAQLYPVYLMAVAAGLLSGLPGGFGAFDIVLLSVLADGVPGPIAGPITGHTAGEAPGAAIAALLAYRLLAQAAPAILALWPLIRPPWHGGRCAMTPDMLPPQPIHPDDLRAASQAEMAVLLQSEGLVLVRPDGALGLIATPQTLVQFLDPIAGRPGPLMQALCRAARGTGRLALAYKVGPRTALAARAQGWCVRHIADEALLDPASFDLNTPTRRTLRRKLRHAAAAGVRVQAPAASDLPWPAMIAVDRAWQTARGPARGTTMGRLCRATAAQRCYMAWQGERLVAFVSFHDGPHARTLDLMRATPDAPDGTMQALIMAALSAARADGMAQLSLAAIPSRAAASASAWSRRLSRWHMWLAGAAGLVQFKDGFAPIYAPRYAAAPGRLSLALGLLDLAAAIRRPPLPPDLTCDPGATQDHPEDYAVARNAAA